MPLGAFRINAISKVVMTATVEVIRRKKSIIAVGNAQLSTAASVFGGTSLLLDGSGDYLQLSNDPDYTFTGDVTVECWYRTASTNPTGNIPFFFNDHLFYLTNDSGVMKYAVFSGGSNRLLSTSLGTITGGTWYHVAFVRNGSNLAVYHNGNLISSSTWASTMTSQTNNFIGSFSTSFFNGYIDEFRISNSARYTANFTTPTTRFTNDANTVLLIHCDGTNASTFFEDDNGIRQPVVPIANGTVSISTTQSKFGGSSGFLNITSSTNNALQFGSFPGRFETSDRFKWGNYTNYTIESWVYFTSWTNTANATGEGSAALCGFAIENGFESWGFGFNRTGKITLTYSTSGGYGNITLQESGTSGTLNAWHHVAFVKSGTSLKLYVNGTERAAGTLSGTVTYAANNWFKIGQTTGGLFVCYFDEFRCSDVARYTANFTAPTEPFVNDANTLLLLHSDGTNASTVFRDDNGALANRQPKYIAPVGNAQISTAQSQFGGASALFDGTGDYLTISPNSDFNFGTGDFTIETWFRIAGNSTANIDGFRDACLFSMVSGTNVATGLFINGNTTTTGTGIQLFKNQNTQTNIVETISIAQNTWHHIAVSRSGSSIRIFLNGTQLGSTVTNSTIWGASDYEVRIARNVNSAYIDDFNGFIDELRVSNVARYTANFTPSTTPFVNDANTRLLIHANGANASTLFLDDTGNRTQKGVAAVGNAQLSTAQSKFGGSSYLGDGSGDYLRIDDTANLAYGTSDFTIEFWIRFSGTATQIIWDQRPSGQNPATASIYLFNNNIRYYANGSDRILSGVNPTLNQWYHLAVSRSGTSTRMFIDGAQVGSTYTDTTNYITGTPVVLGAESASLGTNSVNGYIDELRVSKTARYVANFTVSTTQFVNDADTLILLHMDGTNASTVFFDDNGVAPYTPT